MTTRPEPAAIALILETLQRALGSTIVGAYLYGSAICGGLRPDSDIDVLVVTREPIVGDHRSKLINELLAISGRARVLSRPLEVTVVVLDEVVPWRFPPRNDLVYGEWLRAEFEAGAISPPATDPDLTVLLTTARENSHPLFGPPAAELLDPIPGHDLRRAIMASLPSLLGDLRGDERNVMLTLARMWVTLSTGEILSKDAAANWVIDKLPPEIQPTLAQARASYLGEERDSWHDRQDEVDAFVGVARTAIEVIGSASAE